MTARPPFSRPILDSMHALVCPRCSHDYLHQGVVEVFNRGEDQENVSRTTVDGNVTCLEYVPNEGSGNPSSRRHGLCVHFYCEMCGDGLTLTVAQHKGTTLLDWRIEPASEW